jgi:hypothetical protein
MVTFSVSPWPENEKYTLSPSLQLYFNQLKDLSTSPMVAAESISSLIFCLGTDPPEADIRKSANTTASRFEKESFFMSVSL